jgi:uncharacterized protein (TIGR04255 family)
MTSLDPEREVYPNAPLKLVTFEVRFDPVELAAAATERFVEALRERFPIAGPPPHQQLLIGPSGASATSAGVRVFDTARRHAVALAPQAMSYETSAYRRFEEFGDSIGSVLDVVESLDLGVALTRVGLRYIDEIDESQLPDPGAWHRYIDPALSSALAHFDPAPLEHQSAALFEIGESHRVVLRYGLMRQAAVDPTGPLVIEAPPRGRYYLIDIDSAWESRAEGVPLTTWVREKLDELHAPIRQLFENTRASTYSSSRVPRPNRSIRRHTRSLRFARGRSRSRRRFFPIRSIRRRAKSTSCTPRPSRRRSGGRRSISNQNHSRVS